MNILVVNAWHDDNRGDMALVHSAILLLKRRYPHAGIKVVSMVPVEHKVWRTAHISLQQEFPDIDVIASPLPLEASDVTLTKGLRLIAAFLSIFFPWFSRFSGFNTEVKEADLIVSVGGHYLFSYNNNFKSLFRLLRLTQPMTLGLHLKKKVTLFSQSIGPFQGRLAHKVMENTFRKAKCVVRENLSKEVILKLAPKASVDVKPDSAFYLADFDVAPNLPISVTNRYAIFTLREPMKGNIKKVRAAYMQELKSAAEQLLERGTIDKVYVFPHVTGPIKIEDDRVISREFRDLCDNEAIELFTSPLTLPQTLAFYQKASFVVGTRFHSVVFALSQLTPAVALSYYGPKAKGIMSYIGMSDLCFDIETVISDEVLTGVEKCLKYEAEGKIKQQQQRIVDELESLSFD